MTVSPEGTPVKKKKRAAMPSPSAPSSRSVQVVVRLRPMNEMEKQHGTLPVVTASTEGKTITVIKQGKHGQQSRNSMKFDNVFGSFSTQQEVFQATLQPVVHDVFKGYESTVFAYGQTGTGKTHTMEGDLSNPDLYGVIPRASQAIFDTLENNEDFQSSTIACSYLEIYNEELTDLLVASNQGNNHSAGGSTPRKKPLNSKQASTKLEILNSKDGGTFCRGLSEMRVKSAADVFNLMQSAQHQRKIGETKMNKESSRSHCIFTISVNATKALPDGSLFESNGKLHLVDLAGSECAKTANLQGGTISAEAQASRERERMNINRSLLTLGRVISILKEQSLSSNKAKSVRIPYRDSKLTRILQEALGGRCKTVIIATLSPSVTAIEESISTLNYAQAASGIQNKPISTSYLTHHGSTNNQRIMSLRDSAETGETISVEHWNEMEIRLECMQAEVEEAQAALARKHVEQQELEDRAEQAEAAKQELEEQIEQMQRKMTILEDDLKVMATAKEEVENQLVETQDSLKQSEAILTATKETESKLTNEASALLIALEKFSKQSEHLYTVVLTNQQSEVQRRSSMKAFHSNVSRLLQDAQTSLQDLAQKTLQDEAALISVAEQSCKKQVQDMQDGQSRITSLGERSTGVLKQIQHMSNDELVPAWTSMQKQAMETVENAHGLVKANEQSLREAHQSTIEKLQLAREHVSQWHKDYETSSNEIQTTLAKDVSSTQQMINTMVQATWEAIANAQSKGQSIDESILQSKSQWDNRFTEVISNVQSLNGSQQESIGQARAAVSEEMSQTSKMANDLSSGLQAVRGDAEVSSGQLRKHQESLLSHKENLATARERQAAMRTEIMTKIMEGVKTLVDQNFELMSSQCEHDMESFVSSNKDALASTATTLELTESVIEQVAENASDMKSSFKSIQNHDSYMAEFLDKTSKSVETTADNVKQLQQTCTNFGETIDEQVQYLASLHGEVMESGKLKLKEQGEVCSDHLKNETMSAINNSMENLALKSQSIASYSVRLVDETRDSLEGVDKERVAFMEKFGPTQSSVNECLQQGDARTKEILRGQTDAADTAMKDVSNSIVAAEASTSSALIAIEESYKELVHKTRSHSAVVKDSVGEVDPKLVSVCEKTHEFGVDVIKMDCPLEPVPEREEIPYSEKLTSTPSDEIVLMKSGLSEGNSSTRSLPILKPIEGKPENSSTIVKSRDGKPPILNLRSPNMTAQLASRAQPDKLHFKRRPSFDGRYGLPKKKKKGVISTGQVNQEN